MTPPSKRARIGHKEDNPMNTEEKYLQRIEALETDIVILKLAVKELERRVEDLKKAQ